MNGRFGIYNPLQGWKSGDLHADATVFVVLNRSSTVGENLVCVSPSLASDKEVDEVIDQMIKDIEKVRREAKRVLKMQLNKLHGISNIGSASQ